MVGKIKESQLLIDSLWSILGNLLGKGLAFIAGIVIARFLGSSEFGEYGVIKNTIVSIGMFSTFGLGYTTTKFVAELKVINPKGVKSFVHKANVITVIFSGLTAILLFSFSNYIALVWLNNATIEQPLKILSFLIVLSAITTTQIGVLAGYGEFKRMAKISSQIGVLTFIFSILFTYFWSLTGALLALVFVQIINCLMNYYLLRTVSKSNMRNFDSAYTVSYKKALLFSLPVALQETSYTIGSWLINIYIIWYGSYGDLGMFTAAMQWNSIILFIPGILGSVILSHLSGNSTDEELFRKNLKQMKLLSFFATLLPAVVVFIFSGLIEKSYGVSYQGLGRLISIAGFAAVFMSLGNVYNQAYLSKNMNWLMFWIRTIRDYGVLGIAYFILMKMKFHVSASSSLIWSMMITHTLIYFLITFTFSIKSKQKE